MFLFYPVFVCGRVEALVSLKCLGCLLLPPHVSTIRHVKFESGEDGRQPITERLTSCVSRPISERLTTPLGGFYQNKSAHLLNILRQLRL